MEAYVDHTIQSFYQANARMSRCCVSCRHDAIQIITVIQIERIHGEKDFQSVVLGLYQNSQLGNFEP